MPAPIKVLFLAADPFEDRVRLRLDEEAHAIEEAMRNATHRDSLVFTPKLAVRVNDLQSLLLRQKPQIVHFSGHGRDSGAIYLGNDLGLSQAVEREALGRLFSILKPPPRVVVLNACDSDSVAETLGGVVDYTIGMNSPIGDPAAITFAAHFYGALAEGEPVARAFALGVNQLELEKMPAAGIPVLHVRPGVDREESLIPIPRDAAEETEGPESDTEQTSRMEYRKDGRTVRLVNSQGRRGQVNEIGGARADD